MALVATPAVVLSTLRYGETSKIVRLATREHGVQSAIAKGADRPKSRFGASLQPFSSGVAHLIVKDTRELQLLTAFDVTRVRIDLAADLDRFAAAAVLAEVMLRFAPADPHPPSFDLLEDALRLLEVTPPAAADAIGLRILWRMVSVLGFAPSLDACARDGAPVDPHGPLAFSARDGGAVCRACADVAATTLPADARAGLVALLDAGAELPSLDDRHATAHRRLFSRYVHLHLGEGKPLPALDFWATRPWRAA